MNWSYFLNVVAGMSAFLGFILLLISLFVFFDGDAYEPYLAYSAIFYIASIAYGIGTVIHLLRKE